MISFACDRTLPYPTYLHSPPARHSITAPHSGIALVQENLLNEITGFFFIVGFKLSVRGFTVQSEGVIDKRVGERKYGLDFHVRR